MNRKLKVFKEIINSISYTTLFIFLLFFTSGSFLYFYYLIRNDYKDVYKMEVEKYPYVFQEYRKIGYEKSQIIQLLSESWIKDGWQYEPRTVFRETERAGEYVNVSKLGFRRNKVNHPLDSSITNFDKNQKNTLVYFFGGSTTFGYGVPDSHTIPAQLEKISNNQLNVFNFGRGYYYSQQENDLLYDLIKKGAPIPKYAIFLDGINERCWGASYEDQLKLVFEDVSYNGFKWKSNEYAKPLFFIFSKISDKFIKKKKKVGLKFWDPNCSNNQYGFSSNINLESAFSIVIKQREDLCDSHKINCITFIQPMPGYLNIHKHRAYNLENAENKRKLLRKDIKNPNFDIVDITDALKDYKSHAYIDGVHYSPLASEIIAKRIFKKIDEFSNK